MTNLNVVLSAEDAKNAVMAYAGLKKEEVHAIHAVREDGLWEIVLRTDWQRIDSYVDGVTGEVLGYLSEPDWEDCYAA